MVDAGESVLVEVADLMLADVLVGLVDDSEFLGGFGGLLEGELDGRGDFIWVVGVVGVEVAGEALEAARTTREGIDGVEDLVVVEVWEEALEGGDGEGGVCAVMDAEKGNARVGGGEKLEAALVFDLLG